MAILNSKLLIKTDMINPVIVSSTHWTSLTMGNRFYQVNVDGDACVTITEL